MTSIVTKWNHSRCLRSHEVVDTTRRGHRRPPLILNNSQFANLLQLASLENKDTEQKEDISCTKIEFDRKHDSKTDIPREGKDLGATYSELSGVSSRSHSVKSISQSKTTERNNLITAKSHCQSNLRKRNDLIYRDTSTSVQRTRTDSPLVVPTMKKSGGSSNAIPPSEEGSISKLSSPQRRTYPNVSEPSGASVSKPSISTNSNTMEDYHFPGVENTPEMKQLMTLRSQLHTMKDQVLFYYFSYNIYCS